MNDCNDLLQYLASNIDFDKLSKELPEHLLEKYSGNLNWDAASENKNISLDFIRKHKDEVNWTVIVRCQKLTEDFIREFCDRISLFDAFQCQDLSEEFILEFKCNSERCLSAIFTNGKQYSEEFIRKVIRDYNEYVSSHNVYYVSTGYWDDICSNQKLSEKFIEDFVDYVDWCAISSKQTLSEDFISKHKNDVSWYCISRYQNVSLEFVKNNTDIFEGYWAELSENEKVSQEVREEAIEHCLEVDNESF